MVFRARMLPGAEACCKVGGLVASPPGKFAFLGSLKTHLAQSVKQKCYMLMWWLCGVLAIIIKKHLWLVKLFVICYLTFSITGSAYLNHLVSCFSVVLY